MPFSRRIASRRSMVSSTECALGLLTTFPAAISRIISRTRVDKSPWRSRPPPAPAPWRSPASTWAVERRNPSVQVPHQPHMMQRSEQVHSDPDQHQRRARPNRKMRGLRNRPASLTLSSRKNNSNRATTNPNPIIAMPVRIQARNVRSAARENSRIFGLFVQIGASLKAACEIAQRRALHPAQSHPS